MPVPDFTEAQWSYYMTNTETMGLGIVIWIHDYTDFDKRAEVTQVGGASGLEKAAGQNAHEFDTTTAQMFYYGENTTGTSLTAGAANQYTWDQFRNDNLFKNWTIYRISFEYGWDASGTFESAFLEEARLQGINIPLKAEPGTSVSQYATGSGAMAETLSPKTPFQLVRIDLHLNAVATQESFTATVDAGKTATVYDTLLISKSLVGVTDYVVNFGEGYDFLEDDEIDCAWTNTDGKTWGLTYTWKALP